MSDPRPAFCEVACNVLDVLCCVGQHVRLPQDPSLYRSAVHTAAAAPYERATRAARALGGAIEPGPAAAAPAAQRQQPPATHPTEVNHGVDGAEREVRAAASRPPAAEQGGDGQAAAAPVDATTADAAADGDGGGAAAAMEGVERGEDGDAAARPVAGSPQLKPEAEAEGEVGPGGPAGEGRKVGGRDSEGPGPGAVGSDGAPGQAPEAGSPAGAGAGDAPSGHGNSHGGQSAVAEAAAVPSAGPPTAALEGQGGSAQQDVAGSDSELEVDFGPGPRLLLALEALLREPWVPLRLRTQAAGERA